MKTLFILIVLSITLTSCSDLESTELPLEAVPVIKAIEKERTDTSEIEKPLITSAKLVAIGDILVHQSVYTDTALARYGIAKSASSRCEYR